MSGGPFGRYARIAVFLAFAATAQFCFLNPQPEPPADRGTSCPTCITGGRATGGTGGSAGTGAGGTGGSVPPINPVADAGASRDASTGSADVERADRTADDAPTDVGPPDGEDDATDGDDDHDALDDTADGASGDDVDDAAADETIDGDAGIADAGGEPKPSAQP